MPNLADDRLAWTGPVFIEIPLGGGTRLRFEDWRNAGLMPFPGVDKVPALAVSAYGCLLGTWNPVDSGPLDAHVLAADGLEAGAIISATAVGIRFRGDLDHKLIVVPKEHPLSRITHPEQLPAALLDVLSRWVDPEPWPEDAWGSATDAIECIWRFSL